MSEQQTPRPGDRVRAQTPAVEGVVESVDGDGLVLATGGGRRIAFDSRCTVEVLERADDPARDLVGTVRESDGRPYAKKAADHWVLIGEDRDFGDRRYDRQMANVRARVIGSVPGAPAAEAELPDWEREILEREAARQPESTPAEARKLIVHPTVWKSLKAWLTSVRIQVVQVNRFDGDQSPVFAMVPMDGEWGGDV